MPKILLNKSNVDLDYPICRPSLDLDFTQEVLDERITFSRGSIGTRVNRNRLIETVAANQPRFDYDPVTGECKGLLIEESSQNLLTYSEDFSNASWTTSQASIIVSSIVSPSGSTSFKLIENTVGNVGHYFTQGNISKASNAVLTLTIFAKAAERQYMGLVINSFSTGFVNRYGAEFNLGNGTARNNNPAQGTYTNGSFSIEPYPNGWYKCRITCTTSTDATSQVRIFTFRDVNQWTSAASYSGDGTSGIYIWGAQLEAGAFPTSYIPTSDSTVTRSADNASMTGNNFSSWYNQTEGTIYLSLVPNYSNAVANRFKRYLSINVSPGSGQDNVIQFISVDATNQIQSALWFNSVFQAGANLTVRSGAEGKIAYSLKQNSAVLAGNGSILQNDTACILPTNMNRMDIGGYGGIGGYQSSGCYKRITYYPRALKPNQLQLLTQ